MDQFSKDLMSMKEYCDDLNSKVALMINFNEKVHLAVKDCHICKKLLIKTEINKVIEVPYEIYDRVADYCHITGKYWGTAHNNYNL